MASGGPRRADRRGGERIGHNVLPHFGSKEDAFLGSHLAIVELVETAIRDRSPDLSIIDALRVVVDLVLEMMPEEIVGDAVHRETDAVPELRDRMRDHEDRIRIALAGAPREACPPGQRKD